MTGPSEVVEMQVVTVLFSDIYHRPMWLADLDTPASYRLGTKCGLDIRKHNLRIEPKPPKLKPCRKCYP